MAELSPKGWPILSATASHARPPGSRRRTADGDLGTGGGQTRIEETEGDDGEAAESSEREK